MRRSAWLMATLAALLVGSARIGAATQGSGQPAEIGALYADINDIDKLRVINPLKLSADQVDRLIAILKTAQDDYDRKFQEIAVPPIRGIASDVKETRQRVLAGGAIPKDFDDKVKKLEADMLARRKQLDNTTLKSLAASIRKILTTEQVKAATSLAKKVTARNGEPTMEGTDEQFFNLYVRETFMAYARILPLLQDVKKALAGG